MARNKYRNTRIEVDGIIFASKKEAARYECLKARQSAGKITGLKCQPEFVLQDGFRDSDGRYWRPIKYVADFEYFTPTGKYIVEDVKGSKYMITDVFKLKEKLFRRKYPAIDFRVVIGGTDEDR